MKKIFVTKSFLPRIEEYKEYIDKIWDSGQITNQGPLLKEFESKVSDYLGVKNFHLVTNGTLALQVAMKALDITDGEVITTPFSYVATTSAILWERCQPVYVDIDPRTLNIDPLKIEAAITKKTKAIMAVHVFGNPCDVEVIEKIAKKHNLKVIYDAAHAFGVKYKGKSLLSYGDISICSFHATKLFHTIEGGCIIAKHKSVSDKVDLIKRFGHNGDEHFELGINAKASEFQAAMGLCNLKYIDDIADEREKLTSLYNKLLGSKVRQPQLRDYTVYNNAYYPIILESDKKRKQVLDKLNVINIYPRRYFYPSLNRLPYLKSNNECLISEDVANRILCLPLYAGLDEVIIRRICGVITGAKKAV